MPFIASSSDHAEKAYPSCWQWIFFFISSCYVYIKQESFSFLYQLFCQYLVPKHLKSGKNLGDVSLTFRELSKIFSWKLYITQIIFLMRISNLNFVRVPKSHAVGTCTKFQLEILSITVISGIIYFHDIILKSSRNASETTPWPSGVCFTNVLRALQNISWKCVYCINSTSHENFKLQFYTCGQSHALGTRANFQLEIFMWLLPL